MTGHGRGETTRDGCKVAVEIASVNRKQMEINLSLPRELEALEPQVRDAIHQRVARGRLTVRVTLHLADDRRASQWRINRRLAQAYAREAARLAKNLKRGDSLSLDALLRLPGVIETDEGATDAAAFWPAVEGALAQALTALVRMREREGAHLATDLRARVAAMRKLVAQVTQQAPAALKRYREQLLARLRHAGLPDLAPNDERLLKEIALFADRSDIAEELTRLASHFQQFDDGLKSAEPVGRTLDFLAQEMNREVNTLGSKANDARIARAVVALKAELERLREQVQNVE